MVPTILNRQCCSHYMISVCRALVDIDHAEESSGDEMPLQDPTHLAKAEIRTEEKTASHRTISRRPDNSHETETGVWLSYKIIRPCKDHPAGAVLGGGN